MATVLLVPFLLNYIVSFYTFFRLTPNRKKYIFIFPLLNLYPQYEAAKLIYSIYRDPVKGKKEKKDYDQNIGLHEVFLESVPTALIITVIAVKVADNNNDSDSLSLGQIIFDDGLFIDGYTEFFITFSLSVISACVGLAKCLKNGVARTIGAGGRLDGLLSARHLLAFLACGLCLVARGVCLGFASAGFWSDLYKSLFFLFAPLFLLAIFSTLDLSSKSSLKIITHHPSLLLLPTFFTFFTFSRVKVGCCGGESRVMFSRKYTFVNMAVSILGYVHWLAWYYTRFAVGERERAKEIFFSRQIPFSVSPLLLSAILTYCLLILDRLPCSLLASRAPGEVLSVYDPSTDRRYIMEAGEVVEPPEEYYDIHTQD